MTYFVFLATHNDAEKTKAERKNRRIKPKLNKAEKRRQKAQKEQAQTLITKKRNKVELVNLITYNMAEFIQGTKPKGVFTKKSH
jgi:hypothetical protein